MHPSDPVIRPYRPDDIDALMALFVASVRRTAIRDYAPDQIAAWTSRLDRGLWLQRRGSRPTWVADLAGRIAGFADLEPDGHLDMLYVHPECQRRGIGAALLRHVEAQARSTDLARLFTEASITARPFFERSGFVVIAEQVVEIDGVRLRNYRMEKSLTPRSASTGSAPRPRG